MGKYTLTCTTDGGDKEKQVSSNGTATSFMHEFWFALRFPLVTQKIKFEFFDAERVGFDNKIATLIYDMNDYIQNKNDDFDSGIYW